MSIYRFVWRLPKDDRLVAGADFDSKRFRNHLDFCISCKERGLYDKFKHGMKAIPSHLFDTAH